MPDHSMRAEVSALELYFKSQLIAETSHHGRHDSAANDERIDRWEIRLGNHNKRCCYLVWLGIRIMLGYSSYLIKPQSLDMLLMTALVRKHLYIVVTICLSSPLQKPHSQTTIFLASQWVWD